MFYYAPMSSSASSLSFMLRKFHSSVSLRKYVELTANRYPHLKRGNYAVLSDKHLGFFQSVLSSHQILYDVNDVASYNVDWMCSVRGTKLSFK